MRETSSDDLTLNVRMDVEDLDMNMNLDMHNLDELADLVPDENESNAVVDKRYQQSVMKQLILNYLSERASSDSNAVFSKQFLLARWNYEDGEDSSNRAYYLSQWDARSHNPGMRKE
jgi:hypothetical protein